MYEFKLASGIYPDMWLYLGAYQFDNLSNDMMLPNNETLNSVKSLYSTKNFHANTDYFPRDGMSENDYFDSTHGLNTRLSILRKLIEITQNTVYIETNQKTTSHRVPSVQSVPSAPPQSRNSLDSHEFKESRESYEIHKPHDELEISKHIQILLEPPHVPQEYFPNTTELILSQPTESSMTDSYIVVDDVLVDDVLVDNVVKQ